MSLQPGHDPALVADVAADLRDVRARLDEVAEGLAGGRVVAWEGPARREWNRELAHALQVSADAVDELHRAVVALADVRDRWLDPRWTP